ncbi:hypothetical protein EON65_08720 [archaeon]|nr:MAG: hypothetical protein EON65_08720 [archaeon]
MPTSSISQSLGRKQSKSEDSSLFNQSVTKSGFDSELNLSLSQLPVSPTNLFVPSFDTTFVLENNQMFPAPFFIAPFQAIMPPDFNPAAYDGSNPSPYPTPEMFAMYPNMQLIMPMPAAPVQAVMGLDGSPENNSSGTTSAQDTAASTPFEPPQFGPGPPIVTGERLKGPRGCNLFVFHLPNEITNW